MELSIPFIPEDFETGDRVYFTYFSGINKGTVASIGADVIHVVMDDEQEGTIPMSSFVKGSNTEYWGKIPNLKLFEPGMEISKATLDGGRSFVTITSVVPNEEITITYSNGTKSRTFRVSEGSDLEKVFKDWEIEG